MPKKIAVIDTNISNLRNVIKVLKFYNYDHSVLQNGKELLNYSHVILPGVGSFEKGINFLKQNFFIEPLNKFVSKGYFLMGICLGSQLLLDSSTENGNHEGLSIISGKVDKIESNNNLKIPNVGWSKIIKKKKIKNKIFTEISNNDYFYFAHSYVCFPSEEKHILAQIKFGSQTLTAATQKDNVYGFQFHPELSSDRGKQIYFNFLNLS